MTTYMYFLVHVCAFNKDYDILSFHQMQTFYFSFCIFSILADSRYQLCFVGSQWIHLYRTDNRHLWIWIYPWISTQNLWIWIWIWMGNFISTATL